MEKCRVESHFGQVNDAFAISLHEFALRRRFILTLHPDFDESPDGAVLKIQWAEDDKFFARLRSSLS